jgi:hypothetical protein
MMNKMVSREAAKGAKRHQVLAKPDGAGHWCSASPNFFANFASSREQ